MPVVLIGFHDVGQPLLQLSAAANLIRRDSLSQVIEPGGEFLVDAEPARGLDARAEKRTDDLVIHRGAHHQATLLGTVRRTGHQPTGLRVFDEEVGEKSRRLLYDRIGPPAQEFLVLREQKMLPGVEAQPRPSGDPNPVVGAIDRGRAAPEVEVVVQHPAPGAVVNLGLSGGRKPSGRPGHPTADRCTRARLATSAGQ